MDGSKILETISPLIRGVLQTAGKLLPNGLDDAMGVVFDEVLLRVPHDEAKKYLDDAAIRRANMLADLAERAKFKVDVDP